MKNSLLMLVCIALVNLACTTPTNLGAGQTKIGNSLIGNKTVSIQLAILLDTSNSMDGLIDQAKSQLWKMVNELATTKKYGKAPKIEIALYEYGNSGIAATEGYVRQISPLTTDLDLVSEKLFQLTTNGGEEYCGKVISTATSQLEWTDDNDDLRIIFIAGNEPFNQGPVNYKDACQNAISKGIIINTIHCGSYEVGVQTFWKDGADLSDGRYLNIDQDDEVVHIPTPFDDQILKLNTQLNETYIGYGSQGKYRANMQKAQDANATTYSEANMVERAVTKSNKSLYTNDSWDLVDAADKDEEILEELEEEELPEEMAEMDMEERKAFVKEKKEAREKIQTEITELNKKRSAYIAEEQKKNAEKLTLDNVMLETVREQATEKEFQVEQ